jgi:peptide-methionine (R)-S-oxide reductase
VPLSAAELAAAAARDRAYGVSGMSSTQKGDSPGVLGWKEVVELARHGNVAPPRRVEKSDAEWRAALTEEQYYVARRKGTERAFSSELCGLFEPGRYHCVCCDTPLFDSTTKFDSRTGWPSFTAPLTPDVVAYHLDTSYGMERIETLCNVCDAHLGHVFPDGPPPSGLRFCINAVSLRKAKSPA